MASFRGQPQAHMQQQQQSQTCRLQTQQLRKGGGSTQSERQRNSHQGNTGYGAFHEHLEDVYAERRRKNIILRGIPEVSKADDDNIIYEILENLRCEHRYDQIVHFGRIGKRVGRRLLMVTFNNERAVEIILDRAAILNKTRHFKHIYIMKDRPRSERPNRETNTLLEAARGSTSSNRGASTVVGDIQNGGPETTASGAPSVRVPQIANAESSNVNQGSTTDVTQSRTATPNNRTPNARDARAGSIESPVSSLLNLLTTGTNLFGRSPRTRGEETQAPVNIEQRNTQSGNREVGTQDAKD